MIDPSFTDALHQALGAAIKALHASGEDYAEPIKVWRAARGDAAMSGWGWWARQDTEEPYQLSLPTREAVIDRARFEYGPAATFEICEARLWDDDFEEGDDFLTFAASRNQETIVPEVQP